MTVPDLAGPTPEGLSALQERLGGLLEAGGRLTCEPVDTLMPENSGKFRLVYPPR